MILKTVDEACDFIADWCGEKRSYAGQPLSTEFAMPDCILRLNARIGDLWRSAERVPGGMLRYATPFQGLLGGQDTILDPRNFARDEYGIVPLVWENQGVWGYGFDPANIDQLLVSGDWNDRERCSFENDWRRVAATPEDALVCTLLVNLCAQSDSEWHDTPESKAAHPVLWQHPAWDEHYSFRINEERTSIYHGDRRMTRR
jgi:hypothetical protein